MNLRVNYPSCSEYVEHIILNDIEVATVKRLMKMLNIPEKKHILEHFGYTETPLLENDLTNCEGVSFIEEGIVDDYVRLRDIILGLGLRNITRER